MEKTVGILIIVFINAFVNLWALNNNYFVGAERKWSRALMMSLCSLLVFTALVGLFSEVGGWFVRFAIFLFPIYLGCSFPVNIGILSTRPNVTDKGNKAFFIGVYFMGFFVSLVISMMITERLLDKYF